MSSDSTNGNRQLRPDPFGHFDEDDRDRLADLPPSAKYILAILLAADEPLGQSEVIERTALPERTVRNGADRLEEAGLIESGPPPNHEGLRRTFYYVCEEVQL